MPITKWRCPNHLEPQELDHFAVSSCGDVIHPDYAAAVLADDRGHEPSGKVAVGGGLGCPRARVIQRVESLTVDPLAYNSLLTGKAWHNVMEAAGSPDLCEVEIGGKILGLEMIGVIDRVRFMPDGATVLDDHKHTNEWTFKRLPAEEAKTEHVIQLSLYAELYRQTFPDQPASYGRLWYHATVGGFISKRVDFWRLEDCLSYKPYGGQYCVGDLLLQTQGGLEGNWAMLPLAGESQTFGSKSMCDYCSVRDVCWTQARGAPF